MSVRTVYRACIDRARTAAKARLLPLEEAVVDAAQRYDTAARAGALHTLGHLKDKPDSETDRNELAKTYTNRLTGSAGASHYYDCLKSRAPHNTCPLCGHRDVSTLDHQLPKSAYPLLAVAPCNLVPACLRCNQLKGNAVPTRSEEQTIHPYYDDINDGQWLFARVVESVPAAVTFTVTPPEHWNDVLTARLRMHFERFQLASLYGFQSAREMASIRNYLNALLRRAGESSVRQYLEDMAESHAENALNSWKTALYQALAGSPWYTNGGLAYQ